MLQLAKMFLLCVSGHRVTHWHFAPLLFLALVAMGVPDLAGARQACHPNGDVDRNGSVTVTDALLVFQQVLGATDLGACQRGIADVFPRPIARRGDITASDAFCILRKALGLSSCLDILQPFNGWPRADGNSDPEPTSDPVSRPLGTGGDSTDGRISHLRERTGGAIVPTTGAASTSDAFAAPAVPANETLAYLFFAPEKDGTTYRDEKFQTAGTGIEGFISLSAGYYHTCAVRKGGAVECWGSDEDGQSTPPADTFTSVHAGNFHTCGLRDTGAVACWGDDDYGPSTPPEGDFIAVSGGIFHTCGLRAAGVVACWGSNGQGQSTPAAGTFTSISAGVFHTCGLRDTRVVECWGSNDHGQAKPPAGTFTRISAGHYHTCGLRDTGAVECWGSDGDGRSTPPGGVFTFVSAGYHHTCQFQSKIAHFCQLKIAHIEGKRAAGIAHLSLSFSCH